MYKYRRAVSSKSKRKGGGNRINITIGHNLVQPKNLLKINNANNRIMGGRQMDVWSGQ